MSNAPEQPFVSRGGLKLAFALDTFAVDPSGLVCVDLGCSTGGFTDCLLRRGAARVHTVDTAYGQLAWKLRTDDRVVVHERTNALHFDPPELVDLVVFDLGWTPQARAIPAALAWLNPTGRIVALIKPQYEDQPATLKAGGVLDHESARAITARALANMPTLGVRVVTSAPSPIAGGGKRKKSKTRGNPEWLALLEPIAP